jgi:hypothetical protein
MKQLTAEWIAKAEGLSDYAVNFRYPGESADRKTALQARLFCRSFRKSARAVLGFDGK